ncbi:hypothetical protein ACLKA7_010776 [Drosophila subpalustris]
MGKFTLAFAVCVLSSLAISQAAVYIGGGCYDCNPPNGQGPGIYSNGGGATGGGGGRGNGGGGGRPVYSGNFGPGNGGGGRGGGYSNGGGYSSGGYGGGGGYDDGLTQIISG